MRGMIWFTESRIVRKPKAKMGEPNLPKDKWYWSIVGSPCDTRRAARVEEKWYKKNFPTGHFRIRRYEVVEESRG